MSQNYTHKVSREKDSQVKVVVTVAAAAVAAMEEATYNELKKDVKISGFRPGKAPKNQILAKLGTKVLNETLNKLLPQVAAEIVEQESLNPVTTVEYDFEEFAENGDITFAFSFTNYPEVKLGDLSKIKVAKPKVEIEDKEIDDVVQRLFSKEQNNENGEEEAKTEKIEVTDQKVAELKLEGVETVAQLRQQISERIAHVKEHDVQRDYENQVLEEAIKLCKVEVPQALLEQQSQAMLDDHVAQIEKLGVDLDTFLTAQGMDRSKLQEQKRQEAEKRIRAELILNEIAKQNSILPTAEDVHAEIAAISDPETRNSIDSPQGRRHVLSVLVQQRGLQKLMEMVSSKSS